MATIFHTFTPEEAIYQSANFAQYAQFAGSNFPVSTIAYDPTSDENAFWKFRATSYGSGNLTLDLYWYADTASSVNVVWEAAIAAITPDTDTQDVETKAFATTNFVQDTHLGTTGQRLHKATITISNLDSIANGDIVWLRLNRDANSTNATDDMTGDALLALAVLSYSDT